MLQENIDWLKFDVFHKEWKACDQNIDVFLKKVRGIIKSTSWFPGEEQEALTLMTKFALGQKHGTTPISKAGMVAGDILGAVGGILSKALSKPLFQHNVFDEMAPFEDKYWTETSKVMSTLKGKFSKMSLPYPTVKVNVDTDQMEKDLESMKSLAMGLWKNEIQAEFPMPNPESNLTEQEHAQFKSVVQKFGALTVNSSYNHEDDRFAARADVSGNLKDEVKAFLLKALAAHGYLIVGAGYHMVSEKSVYRVHVRKALMAPATLDYMAYIKHQETWMAQCQDALAGWLKPLQPPQDVKVPEHLGEWVWDGCKKDKIHIVKSYTGNTDHLLAEVFQKMTDHQYYEFLSLMRQYIYGGVSMQSFSIMNIRRLNKKYHEIAYQYDSELGGYKYQQIGEEDFLKIVHNAMQNVSPAEYMIGVDAGKAGGDQAVVVTATKDEAGDYTVKAVEKADSLTKQEFDKYIMSSCKHFSLVTSDGKEICADCGFKSGPCQHPDWLHQGDSKSCTSCGLTVHEPVYTPHAGIPDITGGDFVFHGAHFVVSHSDIKKEAPVQTLHNMEGEKFSYPGKVTYELTLKAHSVGESTADKKLEASKLGKEILSALKKSLQKKADGVIVEGGVEKLLPKVVNLDQSHMIEYKALDELAIGDPVYLHSKGVVTKHKKPAQVKPYGYAASVAIPGGVVKIVPNFEELEKSVDYKSQIGVPVTIIATGAEFDETGLTNFVSKDKRYRITSYVEPVMVIASLELVDCETGVSVAKFIHTFKKGSKLLVNLVLNADGSSTFIFYELKSKVDKGEVIFTQQQAASEKIKAIEDAAKKQNPIILAPKDANDIKFLAKKGKEILRITQDGKIVVNGETFIEAQGSAQALEAFAQQFWEMIGSQNPVYKAYLSEREKVAAMQQQVLKLAEETEKHKAVADHYRYEGRDKYDQRARRHPSREARFMNLADNVEPENDPGKTE